MIFNKGIKATCLSGVVSALLVGANTANAQDATAPVSGFAREFIFGLAITSATVTILETGEQIKTDSKGKFGPFNYPVNKPITLILQKWGYKTTQTGTVVVPPTGLTGPYNNITFQVPSTHTFDLLAYIIGAKVDENSCHVVTTITGFQKTMDDVPQGEENAHVTLIPFVDEKPFYFDIFKSGPLKGKTNPFTRGLTQVSEDGGVAFFNLPPRDEPYRISAEKDGISFTTAEFMCHKGMFINISPPQGPMALK
ncbi:MAG: carboxypeptidase regulatory-like domain-containing protein [Gammaproteobacteria bacterium]